MTASEFEKWLQVFGITPGGGAPTSVAWPDVTGKPGWTATFDGSYSSLTGKPPLAAVAISGAYADLSGVPATVTWVTLGGKPAWTGTFDGSYASLTGKPTIGKAVVGMTAKSDAFRIYQNATVASGVAVFQLTADGTAGGAALFPNEVFTDSVIVNVNDPLASYQMGWAFTNSNKTLTVTCNKYTTANILSGILGQAPANGAVVRLCVEGR